MKKPRRSKQPAARRKAKKRIRAKNSRAKRPNLAAVWRAAFEKPPAPNLTAIHGRPPLPH